MAALPRSAPPPTNPEAKLFGPQAIFAFTLLFTPLVGGAMAALNWSRVGDAARAKKTISLAIGAVVVMVAISFLLPDSMESVQRGATIGASMAVAMGLRNEQRPLLEAHLGAGGGKASLLAPALIGVALVAALIGALIAFS
jgi:hypothetical protein